MSIVGVKNVEVLLHILQKVKKNRKPIENNDFAILFVVMRDQFRCMLKIGKIESWSGFGLFQPY